MTSIAGGPLARNGGAVNGSAFAEEADPKTATLILLGEWFLPAESAFWLGELLDAAEEVSLNPRSVRTVVQRWVNDDWFEVDRVGRRSSYRFTAKASERIGRGEGRLFDVARPWSGRWVMLLFDAAPVPAPLQRRLLWESGARLRPGMWVMPYEPSAELRALLQPVGHRRFHATLPEADDVDFVMSLWSFEAIDERYQRFVSFHDVDREEIAGAAKTAGGAAETSGAEAFRQHFWLYHDYLTAGQGDPQLPSELLAADWPGRAARDVLRRRRSELSPVSHRWVEANRRRHARSSG